MYHCTNAETIPGTYRERGASTSTRNRRAAASHDALGGYFEQVDYQDLVQEVSDGLRLAAARAIQQGVRPERILVDPGLGFGKSYAQNLDLVRRLSELRSLDFPLLVGASRKSFTGRLLALPVEQRLETSLATLVLMIVQGADVVRVHDVRGTVDALRVWRAVELASLDG